MTDTQRPVPTAYERLHRRVRAAAARHARAWAVFLAHEQPWREDRHPGPALADADRDAAARLRRPTPRPVTGPDRRSAA